MDNDFDNVNWRNETGQENPQTEYLEVEDSSLRQHKFENREASELQDTLQADMVDLAGVGDGRLDCAVGSPLKEGDGNNAYVSYLVTTQVCVGSLLHVLLHN